MGEFEKPVSTKLPGWLRLAAMLLLVLSGVRALLLHHDIIRFPYPLDSHEPAQVMLSSGYAADQSPCDLEQFPLNFNVYGWAYNAMMGRLCRLGFGCGLAFHRQVAAFMLLACLGLQALALRRLKTPAPESACLLLAAYGSLLVNVTPISRPDSLGLFLTSLGFVLPFLSGYRAWSLALAAAAFSLAWATKLYFLLCPALLLGWLLLNGRFALAAAFGFCFAVLSALLAAWLLGNCETYLYQVYLIKYNQANFNGYNLAYMLWQLRVVFVAGLPGALLLGVLAFSLKRAGLLGKIDGGEWWFYSLGGMIVFVGSLGGHMGTRLTFAIQLVAWPLTVALGGLVPAMGGRRALALACLLLSAICSVNLAAHGGFSNLDLLARWTEAKMFVSAARRPMAPCDLSTVLIARDSEIFDSGFSEYYNPDAPVPAGVRKRFPLIENLNARFRNFEAIQQQRVGRAEFDLVATTPYHFVKYPLQRYRLERGLLLGYPQTGGATPMLFCVRKRP